ncbi:MAG: hypothetical protein GF350_06930, partial [Chitinivibrionales bacterium]|nr:hypothetical protein [Chitinivibrionales bacterium]
MKTFYYVSFSNSSLVMLPGALLLFIFLHCAHQVAPSGGPPDTAPPKIEKTLPEPGAVNHPRSKEIVFAFSEWIEPKSAKKSVTIFPPLTEGIQIRIRGKTLQIAPRKAFADSTTYHIELNNTLKDLHGNSIGTPFHFVFSTGDGLDSGKITGCVIDPGQKILQPKIALFRYENDSIEDTALYDIPDYLIQTDSTGNFSFSNIREGPYCITAFLDKNNDNRLQPESEKAYASSSKKTDISSEAVHIMLFPAISDTAPVRVGELQPASSRICLVSFKATAAKYDTAYFSRWKIVPVDSTDKILEIQRIYPLHHSNRFVIELKTPMEQTGYTLIYPLTMLINRRRDPRALDTLRFNGFSAQDTGLPVVKFLGPRSPAKPDASILLSCREPVKCDTTAWFVADTSGDTIPVSCVPGYGDTIVFTPRRNLHCGREYSFSIPKGLFTDLAGNRPDTAGDTVGLISGSFSTIACDDLCTSLSGKGKCLEPDTARWWIFSLFGSPEKYFTRDSAGGFTFDSIPAGKGTISFFKDSDGDSVPTPGRLVPWKAPEPHIP